MTVEIPSFDDLYEIYRQEAENNASDLTDWNEGSINDILAGAVSTSVNEAILILLDQFKKTFFDSAGGPEETGGPDDLEVLAVDHFGDDFARPAAQKAVGVVAFSRATNGAGDCVIPAGTVVKTAVDANGNSQSFGTILEVTLTGLTINASVEAVTAGIAGNVDSGEISVIESTLTDPSVTVNNADETSGGSEEYDTATYREWLKNKIKTLSGATKEAVEATALTVPGIVSANAIEFLQYVIEWDIGLEAPVGDYFGIPRVKLYVADANGTANDALVDNVEAAILVVRAAGVRIEVIGATAVSINWTANITLNPGGPNYAGLSADPSPIEDTMRKYVQDLLIGADFNRMLADYEMLLIWGPSGTNDLTDFVTSLPSGNISIAETEKPIPNTITVA